MPPTYGDFDQKITKNEGKIGKKMKIRNTFLKMILVSAMVNLMFFAMNTRENGLYYGENGSSRFSNRLYYGENDKKRVFSRFFRAARKSFRGF